MTAAGEPSGGQLRPWRTGAPGRAPRRQAPGSGSSPLSPHSCSGSGSPHRARPRTRPAPGLSGSGWGRPPARTVVSRPWSAAGQSARKGNPAGRAGPGVGAVAGEIGGKNTRGGRPSLLPSGARGEPVSSLSLRRLRVTGVGVEESRGVGFRQACSGGEARFSAARCLPVARWTWSWRAPFCSRRRVSFSASRLILGVACCSHSFPRWSLSGPSWGSARGADDSLRLRSAGGGLPA